MYCCSTFELFCTNLIESSLTLVEEAPAIKSIILFLSLHRRPASDVISMMIPHSSPFFQSIHPHLHQMLLVLQQIQYLIKYDLSYTIISIQHHLSMTILWFIYIMWFCGRCFSKEAEFSITQEREEERKGRILNLILCSREHPGRNEILLDIVDQTDPHNTPLLRTTHLI